MENLVYIGKPDKYSEDTTFHQNSTLLHTVLDFVCAYRRFLVISDEREIDASDQRMHTLDLMTKVRFNLH